MLTILSHIGAVRVLFIIGITVTVLPIFFYNIPKFKKNTENRPPIFRLFPFAVAGGIVMVIPMLCYIYLDIRYDASEFTLNDKLYLAAENNNIRAAESLINDGADPDGETRYGMVAAYRAVMLDRTELEMIFLAAGSDPNYSGEHHMTPIAQAAKNQSCEMAKLLIAAGADPDYMPEKYVTALHYAGMYDKDYNSELVDILIAGGADPSAEAVRDGKIILPYRYYYDEYSSDPQPTEEERLRYAEIRARLYPAYADRLTEHVKENFGYDANRTEAE